MSNTEKMHYGKAISIQKKFKGDSGIRKSEFNNRMMPVILKVIS